MAGYRPPCTTNGTVLKPHLKVALKVGTRVLGSTTPRRGGSDS
jgi:hypothetical protein